MFRSEEKPSSLKQQTQTHATTNNTNLNGHGGDENSTSAELGIAAAPDSLASSNQGGDINDGGGLLYVPELANLPEFEMLPDFLDLPNIAFDESYGSPGKFFFDYSIKSKAQ